MSRLDYNIFILSLAKKYPSSKERTDFLLKQLQNLNFNLDKINFLGIDGSTLKNKKINNKYISYEKYNFHMNLGTLGASLTHGLILKLIFLKKFYTDVLVFEEDAILNKNFPLVLNNFPKDYDIIYLHSYWDANFYYQEENISIENILPNGFYTKTGEQSPIDDNIKNLPCNKIIFKKIIKPPYYNKPIEMPTGLTAYIINGRNIKKIINNLLPIKESADWHYLNQFNNLNQYYVNPNLKVCSQPHNHRSFRATIDKICKLDIK